MISYEEVVGYFLYTFQDLLYQTLFSETNERLDDSPMIESTLLHMPSCTYAIEDSHFCDLNEITAFVQTGKELFEILKSNTIYIFDFIESNEIDVNLLKENYYENFDEEQHMENNSVDENVPLNILKERLIFKTDDRLNRELNNEGKN